jgi:hypothetical protein
MRTLFRLIICTFCYDIPFKCWIFQNPIVFPPRFFGFYGVPTYVESYNFFACDEFPSIKNYTIVLLFLTSYVCNTKHFFPIKNKMYIISWRIICLEFLSYLRYIQHKNYWFFSTDLIFYW